MLLTWISIAENNDTGNRSGKASVFDFGDYLRLEAKNFMGHPFSHLKSKKGYDRFRIHRTQFPYHGSIDWYGNMIFNGYQMEVIAVCDLVNHLWKSGKWNIEQGDCELVNFLKKDGLVFRGDFERIVLHPGYF